MTILLVSFSTKVFRGGAVDKGGTKFAWERYFGGFGVFISFSCPGRFYWVGIPKWDLIQLTAVKQNLCLALDILRLELYYPLNQDQASSRAKLFCHLLEIWAVKTWESIWTWESFLIVPHTLQCTVNPVGLVRCVNYWNDRLEIQGDRI